jgi:glycosyltransferase involved in cell wall biosynthesis
MGGRVRILIDYRPALVQRTGVGEYAHEIARAMAARLPEGSSLALFSSSWKHRLEPGRVAGARTVDRRVPVRLLNLAWHRLGWPSVELLAGAFDVAHSMHPLLMPSRRAARIVTIHDLFFLRDAAGTATEIKRDYARLAGEHARRADAVIAVSEYTASEIQTQLGIPRERIAICSPGAPPWPRRLPAAPNGPIVYVGSPDKRKNLPGLLRAYAVLREQVRGVPRLVLAGRRPERGGEVPAMIRRPPWYPHVKHLGYVTDAERQQLYREAAMLVLPSFDEGFGMPVLEAMTVGVPVVASNRGALPEVLGDAGLLVDPEDDRALAGAMRRMLEDEAFANASVERGVARAARFSWGRSAERLLGVYAEAIGRRRART